VRDKRRKSRKSASECFRNSRFDQTGTRNNPTHTRNNGTFLITRLTDRLLQSWTVVARSIRWRLSERHREFYAFVLQRIAEAERGGGEHAVHLHSKQNMFVGTRWRQSIFLRLQRKTSGTFRRKRYPAQNIWLPFNWKDGLKFGMWNRRKKNRLQKKFKWKIFTGIFRTSVCFLQKSNLHVEKNQVRKFWISVSKHFLFEQEKSRLKKETKSSRYRSVAHKN